ncbi:unnamed protein product [Vicia faba]|uniref:Uncharacterized protein n=1 Tax=Vicia faba TaxID=3906 RepID=A0AAV0ZUU6_VICFA|nr:unnamed protein product [Vicia faba]
MKLLLAPESINVNTLLPPMSAHTLKDLLEVNPSLLCKDSCKVFNSSTVSPSSFCYVPQSSPSSSSLLASHNFSCMCLNLHTCFLFHLSPHLKHSPFLLLSSNSAGLSLLPFGLSVVTEPLFSFSFLTHCTHQGP